MISIYIEATPDDTETRLLHAVRKAIPDADGDSLKEVLRTIRRRKLVPKGGKLLLVVDQFEQWLFAEKNYAKASLTDALLQCDGGVVQAIIMVRGSELPPTCHPPSDHEPQPLMRIPCNDSTQQLLK